MVSIRVGIKKIGIKLISHFKPRKTGQSLPRVEFFIASFVKEFKRVFDVLHFELWETLIKTRAGEFVQKYLMVKRSILYVPLKSSPESIMARYPTRPERLAAERARKRAENVTTPPVLNPSFPYRARAFDPFPFGARRVLKEERG